MALVNIIYSNCSYRSNWIERWREHFVFSVKAHSFYFSHNKEQQEYLASHFIADAVMEEVCLPNLPDHSF